MAQPPKRAAAGSRKNVTYGQAHIKTSFNNTIVTLTDTEGNVIAWESAGSAGFKGSRKSTPFAAQVTADAAAKKGMEHGLEKVEVFAKGAGLRPRDRDPLAAGRRPRRDDRQGRDAAGPQRLPAPQAEARLDGPRHLTPVQAVPPRGPEALPQGLALLHRQVRRRAPLLSARRARPRPHAPVRVPRPAAREAEGAPLLPGAGEAVPQLLRQGDAASRASPARTCCGCSSAGSTTCSCASASPPHAARPGS